MMNDREFQMILREAGAGELQHCRLARDLAEDLAPRPELRTLMLGQLRDTHRADFQEQAGWLTEDFDEPERRRELVRDLLGIWDKLHSGSVQAHGPLVFALAPFARAVYRPAFEEDFPEIARQNPLLRKWPWDAIPALVGLLTKFQLLQPDPELPRISRGTAGVFLILRVMALDRLDPKAWSALQELWAHWQAGIGEKLQANLSARQVGTDHMISRLLPDLLKGHADLVKRREIAVPLAELLIAQLPDTIKDGKANPRKRRVLRDLLHAAAPAPPQRPTVEAPDIRAYLEEQRRLGQPGEKLEALERLREMSEQMGDEKGRRTSQSLRAKILLEETEEQALGEELLLRFGPYDALARHYCREGLWDKAQWAFGLAMEGQEPRAQAGFLARRIEILWKLDRFEEASEAWDRLLAAAPDLPAEYPWTTGLRLQLRSGADPAEVLAHAQSLAARRIAGGEIAGLPVLAAELAQQLGRLALAEGWLTRALAESQPAEGQFAKQHLRLLDRRIFLGRYAVACDNTEEPSISLGIVEIQVMAGIDFFHAGLAERAREYLTNALRALRPEDPEDIRQAVLLRLARLDAMCGKESRETPIRHEVGQILGRTKEEVVAVFFQLLNSTVS